MPDEDDNPFLDELPSLDESHLNYEEDDEDDEDDENGDAGFDSPPSHAKSFQSSRHLDSVLIEDGQLNIDDVSDRKNILLVEDDVYVAKEYGYMLGAYGFSVSYAFDAEQAVKILFEYGGNFDIVVLDIRMHQGKFLSKYDTSSGLRTGSAISKEMAEYCPKAMLFGLSNSNDAFDIAWFEAKDRHRYCNKVEFPPDVFAKYVFSICMSEEESDGEDQSKETASGLDERLIRIISSRTPIMVNFVKEQNMGDKYEAGQVGAQGKNAHAHDIVFNQIWDRNKDELDLVKLASQLTQLREAMAVKASSQPDYVDIGNVASAEIEATKGNGPKALEYLKKTGKWTLNVAEQIGVGVAVAAIGAAVGL